MRLFSRLTNLEISDPDDARKRKLLNILVISVFVFTTLGTLLATIYFATSQDIKLDDLKMVYVSGPLLILGTVLLYIINRYWSGQVAGYAFLLLMLIVFIFADTPFELSNGRSLFVFVIPITMASLLIRPMASFVFAALSSIEITLLALSQSLPPNAPAITGFFLIALVSWLSANSMEKAIIELRTLNRELDHRVEVRTRELSEALTRELIEAGKTQAILQGIADGVLVFNQENNIVVANPSMGIITGVRPNKLLGMDLQTFCQREEIFAEDRPRLLNLLEKPSQNAAAIRVRWNKKTLSVNAAPVVSGLGETFGSVAVFRDFTREAEIEQMKNNFVAMVSHELRTPLNAVLAYAEMLRDAIFGPLNTKQFDAAQRIYVNSQRLLNIISDLLDQAQIEAGRLKIQLAQTHTVDLIENLRTVMEKPAHDKGLELTTEIAPEVPTTITCDAHRIQQILVNLVNNAIKFTSQGQVSVRIFLADPHTWALAVSDTGPGIPPDDQAYVFEPFWQVESITTREHGGIGLGLSIVKRLVTLMGGDIKLESTVGKGSTFTVTLPLQPVLQEEESK